MKQTTSTHRSSGGKKLLLGSIALVLLLAGIIAYPKSLSGILRAEEDTLCVSSCTVTYDEEGQSSSADGAALLDGLKQLRLHGPFLHNGTFLNAEQSLFLNLTYRTSSGETGYAAAQVTLTQERTYVKIGRWMYVSSSDLRDFL